MTDTEIFNMLEQSTGITSDDVIDFRPCNKFYADMYGIPDIKDAILIQLKGNGSLIYIPDKDAEGNPIDRDSPKKPLEPKVKIVMHDGILRGTFMNENAKATGISIDIVDADSEYDSEDAVNTELSEEGMTLVDIGVRHPKKG